jgi:dTDP-4-amino-4,6-dideoxygalactose transaminase
MNIDPEAVRARISPATKAVLAVHLFGLPADWDDVSAAAGSIPVVEDACQAIGAEWHGRPAGSLGRAAALSFFPTKNLGGAGDGGMVLTGDDGLAETVKALRNHGQTAPGQFTLPGGSTGRLDEVQAAVLAVKLPYLEQWNRQREENAAFYSERLAGVVGIPPQPADRRHVFHQYTIRCRRRDALRAFLAGHGVPAVVYYPEPLHLLPVFRMSGWAPGDCPEAEKAAGEVLSLPVAPGLKETDRALVADLILRFHETGAAS